MLSLNEVRTVMELEDRKQKSDFVKNLDSEQKRIFLDTVKFLQTTEKFIEVAKNLIYKYYDVDMIINIKVLNFGDYVQDFYKLFKSEIDFNIFQVESFTWTTEHILIDVRDVKNLYTTRMMLI